MTALSLCAADEKTLADARTYCADLSDEGYPWRHDSHKLA